MIVNCVCVCVCVFARLPSLCTDLPTQDVHMFNVYVHKKTHTHTQSSSSPRVLNCRDCGQSMCLCHCAVAQLNMEQGFFLTPVNPFYLHPKETRVLFHFSYNEIWHLIQHFL